jgi:diguanylate cyclase (GGDEF)-like protein
MGTSGAAAADRHFAGVITGYVIAYLESCPAGTLERVFDAAGETRTAADLASSATWSSYDQVRRLLEATAALLGGPSVLEEVGAAFVVGNPEFAALVQSMGSPDALFAALDQMGENLAPCIDLTFAEVAPAEWTAELLFRDGFAGFPEYCRFCSGMIASGTLPFGLPPAEVVEEACVHHGAPVCRFRVRWEPTDLPAVKAAYFERRSDILSARLEALHETVADLVSGDDLESVLGRIVATTAKAVSAPAYVLALDELPGAAQRVYGEGLSNPEAAIVAADLLADGAPVPGRLVVEVASPRRRYGRLAAIQLEGHRFFPQESVILQAYARLAAAALDSAAALEEARRQTATAKTLLALSSSLAEVVSVDEVAGKLVRAVREIVDCDRAAVVLVNRATGVAQVAAAEGYAPSEETEVLRSRFQVDERFLRPGPSGISEDEPAFHTELSERVGSVGRVSAPIVASGELLGWLAASVTTRPGRLRDPELPARMRGLAAQAATAVRNARLLDQIRHQALHDTLTGLPNRALILDRVEQMLARGRRTRAGGAVLFLDLDGFKEINDTLGHAAGDHLLRSVAARLSATLRGSDTIGRLGGDEFVVLVESENEAGAELVAERLLTALEQPFVVAGVTVNVSASIGLAAGDRQSAGEMLRDADIALYEAKAAGKHRVVVFHPEMHVAIRDHHLLESDLRGALARGELFLVYQPIWDLEAGRVLGVEALLRWRHPARGVVSPEVFVPMLEENGLIIDVGAWVLEAACRDVRALHERGHALALSVNVSGRQLDSADFADVVERVLGATGFDPAQLVLEITESVVMRSPQTAADGMRRLRATGVRIAIDDFGTGYSSLALLRQMPVDSLKIDRSFVAAIRDSVEAEALVRMLVQLGKTLGLTTVAEGIEVDEQLHQLRRETCDSGQGFLLARPLELEDLVAFLAQAPADGAPAAPAVPAPPAVPAARPG